VLAAELVGSPGVRRTIAVRSDQTLVHVHGALQEAFGWDDDHLYSFWLSGRFWAGDGSEYTDPFIAARRNPVGRQGGVPAKSAAVRLDRLRIAAGQRIAYLFDFGDEWRVELSVREVRPDDGSHYPQLLHAEGEAPPQYVDCDGLEDVA